MKTILADLVYFPMPGIFLTVIGLVFLRGKLRKTAIALGMAILVLLSFPIIPKMLARPLLVQNPSIDQVRQAQPDVILVATGGAMEISLEDYFPNDNTLIRIHHADRLQRELGLPVIISGGDPRKAGVAESVLAMRAGFLDSQETIVDESALNTAENAIAFATLMQQNGFSRPVLVTQAIHSRRMAAALLAQGFASAQHPAMEKVAMPVEALDFIPSLRGYRYASRVAVAYAAIVKYMLLGHFGMAELTAIQ